MHALIFFTICYLPIHYPNPFIYYILQIFRDMNLWHLCNFIALLCVCVWVTRFDTRAYLPITIIVIDSLIIDKLLVFISLCVTRSYYMCDEKPRVLSQKASFFICVLRLHVALCKKKVRWEHHKTNITRIHVSGSRHTPPPPHIAMHSLPSHTMPKYIYGCYKM